MNEAVVVSAVRSPVGRGKSDGSLAHVHPIDVSATVMRAAVERAGIDPAALDDVLWGCALPEGAQGLNVSRLSLLRAGFPVSVPGATVNRFCSSGLQTIAMGAQAVMSGMADAVLAGGVELMSQVPMSGHHTRIHPELIEPYIEQYVTPLPLPPPARYVLLLSRPTPAVLFCSWPKGSADSTRPAGRPWPMVLVLLPGLHGHCYR